VRVQTGPGSIPLFNIFGIRVEINYSWIIIFALVSINLATTWFPATLPGLSPGIRYTLGAVSALLLFLCVLAHELSHSLVARKNGQHVHGIVLHVFGGVSLIQEGIYKPSVEFKVAAAGPLLSVILGVFFLLLRNFYFPDNESIPSVMLTYLYFVNFMLAIFNLLPGFPLDGGRLLRSLIAFWKKDIVVATRIASRVGVGIAFLLMIYGALSILKGMYSGFWTILIGIFLKDAAESSYRQLQISKMFSGITVDQVMQKNPVVIPPGITAQELVDNYFWRYQYGSFPVGDKKALGIIPFTEVKKIQPENRSRITVQEIMHPIKDSLQIGPDQSIMEAFEKATRNGVGRLIVTGNDGEILGYISLRDIARAFHEQKDATTKAQ
jgi:Zn-dependent protease